MSKLKKQNIRDIISSPLIVFVFIQITIFVIFLYEYDSIDSLRLNDCKYECIVVEEKYAVNKKAHSAGMLHIAYNGETYVFSDSKKSTRELYETISIGESIDVYYVEEYDLFSGKFLWVVDARNENEVYVDINEYTRESQLSNVFAIISFLIVEIIYLVLANFFGIFEDIKSFYKALAKKINKNKNSNS